MVSGLEEALGVKLPGDLESEETRLARAARPALPRPRSARARALRACARRRLPFLRRPALSTRL